MISDFLLRITKHYPFLLQGAPGKNGERGGPGGPGLPVCILHQLFVAFPWGLHIQLQDFVVFHTPFFSHFCFSGPSWEER